MLIEKFRATAGAIGTWNAILYVASRGCSALFGPGVRIVKYYFVVQPLSQPDPAERLRRGKFSIEWVGPDSRLFDQIDRPPRVIARRFAQGAKCLAAIADANRLAGFMWFVLGAYDEDEVRARFVPQPERTVAWDFDVTVQPEFRLGRLFSYLWTRASADLAALGVTHTVSRISAFNASSLAAHRRLGARVVGAATFVCVGRFQLMRSTVTPRWNFSARDTDAPILPIGEMSPASTSRDFLR